MATRPPGDRQEATSHAPLAARRSHRTATVAGTLPAPCQTAHYTRNREVLRMSARPVRTILRPPGGPFATLPRSGPSTLPPDGHCVVSPHTPSSIQIRTPSSCRAVHTDLTACYVATAT